jgi:hypothetical protein
MEKKIKNFLVTGNLKKKVSFQFLPNELTPGSWWIRIQSLSYSINGPGIQAICVITCNLATSLQYSNNIIKNVEQPFAIFSFDPKIKRKSINFEEKWLYINVFSDELILSINSVEIEEKLTLDCDVFFLVTLHKKE